MKRTVIGVLVFALLAGFAGSAGFAQEKPAPADSAAKAEKVDESKSDKKDEKKEEQEQQQKDGEESEKDKKEQPAPSPSDKLKEMNISEEKAKMILEAMKNNEVQYIQQNKRKATKKKDNGKPDW